MPTMNDRHRIRFTPLDETQAPPRCWNCGRPVFGHTEATFIYPREEHALVDQWIECECGAYQNVAHPHRITIEDYKRSSTD